MKKRTDKGDQRHHPDKTKDHARYRRQHFDPRLEDVFDPRGRQFGNIQCRCDTHRHRDHDRTKRHDKRTTHQRDDPKPRRIGDRIPAGPEKEFTGRKCLKQGKPLSEEKYKNKNDKQDRGDPAGEYQVFNNKLFTSSQ